MEKAYKEGKVRALGISNFDNRMETYNAIKQEEIKPQIMQIECHPYAQRKETRELVKTYDIQVECWYPLNHQNAGILSDTTLSSIASTHKKNFCSSYIKMAYSRRIIPYSRKHKCNAYPRKY